MKQVALVLSALLFAACEIPTITESSVDAGSGNTAALHCEVNPCLNGGACSVVGDGVACACLPGYDGVNCENLTVNVTINVTVNWCPPGAEGDHCRSSQCSLIGACGNGTCDGQGGCTCSTGWQGETCNENVDECMSGAPCLHGGVCTDSPGSFSCACTTGYSGMTCANCAVGYQDNDADGICCQTGYKGSTCSVCDDLYERVTGVCQRTCTSAPQACGSHGACDDTGGEPVCDCDATWFGASCDSLSGTCTQGACGAHGECETSSQSTYKCECDPGYYGRSCELIDECVLEGHDPCNGHGTCVDGDSDYTCTCTAGWLGDACDVPDRCIGHQCQNGGLCVNGATTYSCNCAGTGYDGDFCQSDIDFCANTPCQHNGVCSDIGTTFQCDCAKTGYTGVSCESDVDECADVQADVCGAGSCVNVPNGAGYTCQCPDGTLDLDGDGKNCSLVASLAAGGVDTCAISAAGSLHCWGDNTYAQLGNNTSGNPQATVIRAPVRVGTGTGWTKVSVGNGHACGLRAGHLYCWGNNMSRQVGYSSSATLSTPAEPRSDLTWSDVTTGDSHTCGLSGTALYCWGNSADGQAGAAVSGTIVDAPKQLSDAWIAVSAGGSHSCAISTTNELRCWGSNSSGQLGATTQPVALPGGADGPWSAVKAGRTHTCAVAGTHTYCWGAGVEGALGNAAFASSPTPVQVSTSAQLSSHQLGEDFSCGTAPNGGSAVQIYCWGTNQYSLLLVAGAKLNVPQLVTTAGSPAWTAYAVGAHHMCAVAGGLVYCWGSNLDGAVGNAAPDPTPVNAPTLVKAGVTPHSATFCWPNPCRNGGDCTELANGYTCDCAGTGFGGESCTTEIDECATAGICGQGTCRDLLDGHGYTCTCPDGLIDTDGTGTTCSAVEQISAGAGHTCVLTAARTLHCWGSNRNGQLGVGTVGTTDYYPNESLQTVRTPLRLKTVSGVVGDASGWTTFAVGEKHTCAALPTGVGSTEGLYCWGDNTMGQLGIPVVAPQYAAAPVLLDNTQTWVALSASYGHTCGINSAGALYCWGYNLAGQVGNGTAVTPQLFSLTPVPLPMGQSSWIAVAAGGNHTCATTNTNTTYCWGRRSSGQVGIGATGADVLSATRVDKLDPQGFGAVQAELSTSCALAGTSAYCWGAGTTGAIGNGASVSQPSPTLVAGGLSFSSLGLGSSFACGMVAAMGTTPQAYRAYCWGSNSKNLHLTGITSAAGNINTPTALTARQWRVFDVGSSHICGVDHADGLLYCWGDNGVEVGLGKGKLGTVPFSLLGNFGIGVVKTAPAPHPAQ